MGKKMIKFSYIISIICIDNATFTKRIQLQSKNENNYNKLLHVFKQKPVFTTFIQIMKYMF